MTYAAAPGGEAILSGARPITGWERVSGAVHRARLQSGWTFATLFENGVRATRARAPNEGYLGVQAMIGTDGSTTQFVYAPGDIPEDFDARAAHVYVWSGGFGSPPNAENFDWQPDLVPVASIDRATRTITLGEKTAYPVRAGNRYFVQGPRSLLDRPGEFALDEREGFVYYWPRAAPIERQEVVAPATPRLIEVRGASASALARNLAFERLTLTVTDFPERASAYTPGPRHGAILIENAEDVSLRFSRIHATGGSGVILVGHAQRIAVYGNLIEDVGAHGVWLNGIWPGAPRTNRANTIANNHIRRGGRLHGAGSGIVVQHSGENELANNRISDMPRWGVSLGGVTLSQLRQQFPALGATAENWRDLNHSRGNLVRGNDVSRVLTDSQDGAGINLWGTWKNVVEGNRVHDVVSDVPKGLVHGIYLDDAADHNVVRGNLVHGVIGAQAMAVILKGIFNEFTNNVVVASGPNAHVMSARIPPYERLDNLTIVRNIFYAPGGEDLYWHFDWSQDRLAAAERNLFFHPGGTYTVRFGTRFFRPDGTHTVGSGHPAVGRRIALDEWRSLYGFDRDSLIADPKFVDPAAGDYTVRPDSPALALGFVNIDLSNIGLRRDFPFGR